MRLAGAGTNGCYGMGWAGCNKAKYDIQEYLKCKNGIPVIETSYKHKHTGNNAVSVIVQCV